MVLLFQAVEKEVPALPFSSVFFSLLLLHFLFFLFLFMCVFFSTPVPLPVSVSSFSLNSHSPSPLFPASPFSFFLSSLSFSFFSFSSLHSLFSLSVLSPFRFVFSSSFVLALGGIYRVKGAGVSLLLRMGSRALLPATMPGWLTSGCGWQGAAPPVSHHEGAWGFEFWQSARHK